MPSYLLVYCTVPNLREGRKLARLVLEDKLAACVNIVPSVESHYWWKGKLEKSSELLLMMKTRAALFTRLEKTIRKAHSYDTPEIIGVPIEKGSRRYLNWITTETK